jgi:MerR family transcriptional regulator, light-induced transcriptional regulator
VVLPEGTGLPGAQPPRGDACLSIGELARRSGVSVHTLRAWEHRHRLLAPDRSAGGHRRYRLGDVEVVRAVRRLTERGWSVAAACAYTREHGPDAVTTPAQASVAPPAPLPVLREVLWEALASYDASSTHDALDRAFEHHDRVAVLDHLVVPVLRRLGEGWEDAPGVVSQEHAGSHLLRSRLLPLLASSGRTGEHDAVAFCVEGELHDLGLLMAAVTVATAGWYPLYLGARTPWVAAAEALERVRPRLLLVAATSRVGAGAFLRDAAVGDDVVVALGGPGFVPEDAARLPRALHHDGPLRDLPSRVERLQPSG